MPEETPAASPKPSTVSAPASPEPPPLPHLGVEFGTAERNLPPAKIVAVVLAAAAVLLGVYAFVTRAKPQGGGSIDNVTAIEVPDQNLMLVAVNITLHNTGEKPLWIRTINSTLKTDTGEFSDEAASAVDFDRYFQAFPALKAGTLPAIVPETKIAPGGTASGTVIVGFHVSKDVFDKRKSLSVVIQPYDQALPVTLTK
jgi:hypothetical protein